LWPVPGAVIGPVGDTIFDVAFPERDRLDVGAAQKVGGLLTYDVSSPSGAAGTLAPMWPGADVRLAGILASASAGDLVAMGAAGGEVQLWDTSDPEHPRAAGPPFAAARDFVDGLALSADGTMLAVGSDASVVNLWDVSDPARPRSLAETEQAGGQVASVAFQPGANVLAAATTGGNVRLWNIDDPAHPKQIADLTGLPGYALSASFSHDGTLLAAGGSGREIRVWDVHDPRDITPVGAPLIGPANDIGMVAFDPAAPVLAAATYGGVVWQWDMTDAAHPTLVAKLRAADGVLYALAWSPDGSTLSTGGSAQRVWTWTMAADAAAQQVCAAAGQGITPDEWALYVRDRAYDPPCV
jgi:WD40 repeat protein